MAHALVSTLVGILGNILSILLFSSSLPTFWRIAKRRSTESFKGLPYICTLLCTSLWSYYGALKAGGILILSINVIGTVFQLLYLIVYLVYAPRHRQIRSAILIFLLDVVVLGTVVATTGLLATGSRRLYVLGTICSAISVSMYAAPMAVLGTVVRTRSVEFMPFFLSLFLFLNASCWAVYAILIKDIFVEVPNAIGFFLGAIQLALYAYYRHGSLPPKHKDTSSRCEQLPQLAISGVELGRSSSLPKRFDHSAASVSAGIVKQQSLPSKIVKASSMTILEILNFLHDNDPIHPADAGGPAAAEAEENAPEPPWKLWKQLC